MKWIVIGPEEPLVRATDAIGHARGLSRRRGWLDTL